MDAWAPVRCLGGVLGLYLARFRENPCILRLYFLRSVGGTLYRSPMKRQGLWAGACVRRDRHSRRDMLRKEQRAWCTRDYRCRIWARRGAFGRSRVRCTPVFQSWSLSIALDCWSNEQLPQSRQYTLSHPLWSLTNRCFVPLDRGVLSVAGVNFGRHWRSAALSSLRGTRRVASVPAW